MRKTQSWSSSAAKLAQAMPKNWFGQQIAQVLRKVVMQFADLPIQCEVDELKFEFHLRDNNSEKKYLFMPWRFDSAERERLVSSIPKNGVFVDIGANVGIYTLFVAKHLNNEGRVVSFEPNPSAHKRLAKNVALNEDVLSTTISLLQLGVADTDSTFELRLDRDNLGGSSLVVESGEVVQVHCKPLLEVLESLGIERVNGLKIDIEGAEDVALTPFLTQAPRSMLPDIIVIENSEHLWKTDLFALIRSSGYSLKLKTRMNSVYQLM